MKHTYTIALLVTLAVLLVFLPSCGTGTVVTFGPDGIEIQPPSGPIVIPTK
jgi:hypothetical protein